MGCVFSYAHPGLPPPQTIHCDMGGRSIWPLTGVAEVCLYRTSCKCDPGDVAMGLLLVYGTANMDFGTFSWVVGHPYSALGLTFLLFAAEQLIGFAARRLCC